MKKIFHIIIIAALIFHQPIASIGQFTKLLDFNGATNGNYPFGSFTSDGTFLYAMTSAGGTNGFGNIFKIKPDGTGYATLLNFAGAANGRQPTGSLIYDGTFLYGMTYRGGASNLGIIFKIKPDGSGFVKLFDFGGVATGSFPLGSLLYDGTFLYGLTSFGGSNNHGTVFKIMPDGTGFLKLMNLWGSGPDQGSVDPHGAFVTDGTFLYATTNTGGTGGGGGFPEGTILKIQKDGSGYTKIHDFNSTSGSNPTGDLVWDGTFLYGMSSAYGANMAGTIFKIKPDGTGFVKLHDFGGGANGKQPLGSLIYDGVFLYGMTYAGGTNNLGTIFKIRPDGTGYTRMFDFTGNSSGSNPYGSLYSDGTFLFGLTFQGGTNNLGAVFKSSIAPFPMISGFSPSTGPSGTTVTITGSGFDLTPSNNLVSFNGTNASVISSSGTSVTVNVPPGTTTGPISITVNSITATSATNFIAIPGPPVITDFNPKSGLIGTTVTITGFDFSITPADNIVYFGATQATVTAATTIQLTVTVPTGATYQPITVTAGGATAYSNKPFIPTFIGGGSIDGCSFEAKVDFTTGATPLSTYLGDLDGDGKTDLVTGNQNANTISVFRNTSLTGVVNASSFSIKTDFAVGVQPYIVIIGDIDSDGKPDIAVANDVSGTISVLRNTSVAGSISTSSFSAAVDFTTGLNTHSVVLRDLDGDGKPELVGANLGSNTLSVLKNTSVTGDISGSSFATQVDFNAGPNPQSIAIDDLDGDGKPDLVVTNSLGNNSVSVLQNTTVQGVIDATSFAAPISFTTGFYPRSLAIGDLDADGKPDLVTANNTSNTISILKNTCSIGSITTGSFDTKVDFSTSAGPHCVTIGDVDGDGKPDLAIAHGGTSVGIFKNISSAGILNTSSLEARIDFTTGLGSVNVVLGDLDGDGKPELVAAEGGVDVVSVFHNLIGLMPSPPTSPINASICGSGSVTLSVSGGANGFYRWYTVPSGGTAIAGAVNNSYVTPNLSTSAPYYVTVSNGTCESSPRTPVTATIIPVPASPSVTDALTCPEVPATLIASGATNGQYRWYTVVSGGTPINNETNSSFTSTVSTGTTYFVSINNSNCEGPRTPSTISLKISGCEILIFNGLSPNMDNRNDIFLLENIGALPDTKENRVTIFNRWGDAVFEVENYDNVNRVFNGNNKNGEELPAGIYFYKIEFTSGKEVRTGYLSLKR